MYFPGNPDSEVVPNYYLSDLKSENSDSIAAGASGVEPKQADGEEDHPPAPDAAKVADAQVAQNHQKDLSAVDSLSWAHPKRIFTTIKLVLMYGINKDVIHHQSQGLEKVHERAVVFDNKVEHLWTTAQVCSAMVSFYLSARLMSRKFSNHSR